jgi:hypothetical protein
MVRRELSLVDAVRRCLLPVIPKSQLHSTILTKQASSFNSYSQSAPSGSRSVRRSNIGGMNPALVF